MQNLSEKIKQKVIGVIADGPISQEFAQGYNRGLADAATLAEQWEREQRQQISQLESIIAQGAIRETQRVQAATAALQAARVEGEGSARLLEIRKSR